MCSDYLGLHEYETVVVWSREGGSVALSALGIPGGQGAKPGALVGPPGQYAGNVGGSPPD